MEEKRLQFVLLVLLAALIFGGGYYYAVSNRDQIPVVVSGENEDAGTETSGVGETGETIKIHVGGAVAFPGVYELPPGARKDDAVRKASPLLEADLDSINLALPLHDGDQIIVPRFSTDSDGGNELSGSGDNGSGMININKADAEELEKLPGIGPATSAKIMEYRQKNGAFKTVDDIQNVSGIGSKKFDSIRELITIN